MMKIKYFKEKKGRMVLNAGQMRLLDWMLQRQSERILVPDVGMIYSNVWFLSNPPGTGKTRVLVMYIQETRENHMSSLIITCKTKIHRWIKELVASGCSYEMLHKKSHFHDSWSPCTTVVLITAASYNHFMMKCGHRIKWKHVVYEYPLMYYIRNMCTPTTCILWIITPNPRFLLHHRFSKNHFLFTVFQRLNDQLIQWISIRNLFHDIRKQLMYDPIHRYIYMKPSFHIVLYTRDNCLTRSYTNTHDLQSIWRSKDKVFRLSSSDSSSCIICLNDTIALWLQTPCCFKLICDECAVKWFIIKPQCPNCRATLNDVCEFLFFHRMEDNTLQIFDIPHTDWKVFITSGLKYFKTIIFTSSCDYDSKHTLTSSNHCRLLNEFRSSSLPSYVIVPNKKWMMGQEVPECSDMVFVDQDKTRWTMEDKIYFIGRAQRIGRTAPLNVHHIIVS